MRISNIVRMLGGAAFLAALVGSQGAALAERPDDGLVFQYQKSLEGKKVAFVPISMGFDLTQGWMAAVQRDAERLGYEVIIRDPNWNIDAGAQALEQLISEKPDILIFHNNDTQAYAKLVQRAMGAGINVIQMNLKRRSIPTPLSAATGIRSATTWRRRPSSGAVRGRPARLRSCVVR